MLRILIDSTPSLALPLPGGGNSDSLSLEGEGKILKGA
jgi:hypothetical protein